MKNNPLLKFGCILFSFAFLTGCKFYFSEDEYLGTYTGYFEAKETTYKSCNGELIITDVGDFKVNIELITDSNPTYYFTNVSVDRGYSLYSDQLRLSDDVTYGVGGYVHRINHSIYFNYHNQPSNYDYFFRGDRQ
jgi:hypothetical protein